MVAINVGCGRRALVGYDNIDLQLYPETENAGVIVRDIREGLPYADGTAFLIRSSQFIEHLELTDIPPFFRECWRVLCIGGELWCDFPDIGEAAKMASTGALDFELQQHGVVPIPGVPAGLQVLNMDSHGEPWNHKCILTSELVGIMMSEQGLSIEWVSTFGPNALVKARKCGV